MKGWVWAVRHATEMSFTWVVLTWSLLACAVWLMLHRQRVQLLRVDLPSGCACAVVRQPRKLWVLLDRTHPDEARAELHTLLTNWPTERIGENLSPLAPLAGRPPEM